MEKNNRNNVRLIIIAQDQVGQRIDNLLRNEFKGMPKSFIYRLLRKGEIRVNKKRIKPSYKLKNMDIIRIPPLYHINDNKVSILPLVNKKAVDDLNNAVLYEDDYLLVLNKPAKIAVHGGSGICFGIIELLRSIRPYDCFLELVHRLDRETSGALLVAKKRSVLRALHEQLREKKIKKHYLALVHGQWKSDVKVISVPLIKNIAASGEHMVRIGSEGKNSETHFKVEERFAMLATLVRAIPVTGRTHQIRVHTQYAGHPIAFDKRYGDNFLDLQLKKYGMHRLFLHATALYFKHPASGEKCYIEAPLDASLHLCLNDLRQHKK